MSSAAHGTGNGNGSEAPDPSRSRSAAWVDTPGMDGFLRRTSLKAQGLTAEDYRRPIIGICNNTSDFNRCHTHFDGMVEAVKQGVLRAGGLPRVFNSMTMGADNTLPLGVSFMHRNLLAMEVEQIASTYPMDGLVLFGACDESVPAMLMAAASIDLPAIVVPGGPSYCGYWRGRRVGSGYDCHRAFEAYGREEIGDDDLASLEDVLESNPGHCNTMGTAATMTTISEALGMSPAGSSAIPAVDARRLTMAREVGAQVMELVAADMRPSQIMTAAAFDNAIRALATVEGSCNAVVHLLAVAHRVGIDLPLERFDELSTTTPVLLNLRPAGEYYLEDLFRAGGIPAVLNALGELIDRETLTVTGRTLGEEIQDVAIDDPAVIGTPQTPVSEPRGVAVLRGNIAPDGAIMRLGVASAELMTHSGRAVVFEGHEDLEERLYAPDFDIRPGDVIVLRGEGPRGSVGMPEYGHIELPQKILQQGIDDMLRVTDNRIGGTVKGSVVQFVSPEAAVGGPLGLVRTGDMIRLDVPRRTIDIEVSDEVLAQRREEPPLERPLPRRGFARLYADCVTQADRGCDFEFLGAVKDGAVASGARS